jgi:hypothetical protein
MPKYRAKIQLTTYADFEFDADNDSLAFDHMERLMEDYNDGDASDGYAPKTFIDYYCSTYKTKVQYSKIQSQEWKDI